MIEEATLRLEAIVRTIPQVTEADRRVAAVLSRCLSELHETAARSARASRLPGRRARLQAVTPSAS